MPPCHGGDRQFKSDPGRQRGSSSVVEHNLAKVGVAGSSPVFRSIWRHSQAVRQRSAKPLSPVRFRVAPPKEKHPKMGCFSFGYAIPPLSDRLRAAFAARNPVRICRSEIDKLACQAESVQIFAFGEIPGGAPSLHRIGSVPPSRRGIRFASPPQSAIRWRNRGKAWDIDAPRQIPRWRAISPSVI